MHDATSDQRSVPREEPPRRIDEAAALRSILEGTATETGERFFAALVENLARALGTHAAWVTEYREESRSLCSLAFWLDGKWIENYEYAVAGTPCEPVVASARLFHVPERVIQLYPNDADLPRMNAVSYMGVPLEDLDGTVLGHLAVLDTRPLDAEPRILSVFRIFAARAAAELRRIRAESEVREREEQLRRLIDSAMDAIVEIDPELRVTLMNPAAEKLFAVAASQATGGSLFDSLSETGGQALRAAIEKLGTGGAEWIAGGLLVRTAAGAEVQTEATLSRSANAHGVYHTLILRSVQDRIEAERRIESLARETAYLREEIRDLRGLDEIVGQSPPMMRLRKDIEQVAVTDSTVLILGETGTGKELVARAIHAASRRSRKPLVRVNCAAIPATLIESELFGHEKGSFTGATQSRDGRFALADQGTIFLDEIGELSLDLQAKLLRVLQEGEFERVGSSVTRKVDVRVVAATNRDLQREISEGRFREDLYYRLNVFPIRVPALRERGDDVALLAASFERRIAERMGRTIAPLDERDFARLAAYPWPGNVRELQNVIERAVITAEGGRLNLDRALPEAGPRHEPEPSRPASDETEAIRTAEEMQELERRNILRALEASGWKVAGDRGAARLLGLSPSTLSSRMKALGIHRPLSA